MALKFLDSFDHYASDYGGQTSWKWTYATYQGRVTGLHGNGGTGFFRKGMLFGSTTIIMEVYIKTTFVGGIFGLADTNQSDQISCSYTLNDGTIQIDRWGGSGHLWQSPPDIVRQDTWYHFGWKVKVDATNGSVEVRLNGNTIYSVSGIPTCSALTPTANFWSGAIGHFTLGNHPGPFDDLVVMDDVDDGINDPRLPGGGGFDKFLGPVEIVVKRPNGTGLLAEWVPTPSVPNWQNVDDIEPDGDTTYNDADPTAVGKSDLFAMENMGADQDPVAVQSLVCARKTEEGTAAIAKLVNDGGTTTVGPTVYQPSTYSYIHQPEPTLPDGSLWTVARWNAIQYGYKRMV